MWSYYSAVRLISKAHLERMIVRYPQAAGGLRFWYHGIISSDFAHLAALQEVFASADHIAGDRVVFNIKGNHFRLVAAIDFARQVVYFKWFGTHKEYDRIDPAEVGYERPAHKD